MTTTDERRAALLEQAVASEAVRRRYESKVLRGQGNECWVWLGAITRHGHGRFWLGRAPGRNGARDRDVVVIAHRFGFALAWGLDALLEAPVLAHSCDEPWCQQPTHLEPSTQADNRDDWLRRRWHPRSPLRDVRGPRGRAVAVREAARAGRNITAARAAGISALDDGQLLLW
ncbi:hypothetical protein [Barrientosiimonas humi]|uniref:hypothetical protein n=1 Tax=Barrientosiimonas humi TaxID=999931 RepID=UPI00370D312C